MKKSMTSIFFFLLAFCHLLPMLGEEARLGEEAFYQIRDGIPNSQYYLQKNSVGNQYLFFVGESLLNGENRYSQQMIAAMKKHFPEAGIIETRHYQPGGSWFAQFRVGWGQAVFGEIICSGHLVILDFAAGDTGKDKEHVQTQLENILRQIIRYRATHSTILVYTLTPEIFKDYQAGKTPDYITWCEEVADHYQVPSVNLAKYAADRISTFSLNDFTRDGIHPTPLGSKIYGEAMEKFIDALMAANPIPKEPIRKTLPPPRNSLVNDNGRIIAYEQTEFSSDWKPGMTSPIPPFRHLLTTDQPGASLRLKFQGTEIGWIDVVDADSADLRFSIDGSDWKPIPAPKKVAEPRMRTLSLAEKLDRNQEHELVVETASAGVTRVGGILLNGTIVNPYEGLSSLEIIDKIYALMEPISYTPPKNRFRYLPQTMQKLQNGPTLKMVLLGDSIMGNTSSSNFELLLERNYPKCDVVKIASLRSSTGCWFYKEPGNVETYVLRHEPDLLIIGGISQRNDVESIRSVIHQVRDKRPGQEILLLTPVFGSMRDRHIQEWSYEIDTTTDNFRNHLQKLAEDEKCAFFDMTGPWWKYIQDSGKTYGWFMGDAVHANPRGCQIIGRLLEIYFQPESL